MKNQIRVAWLALCLLSTPSLAGQVQVGCQIWVGDELVFQAPQFAHQPYVMKVEGKDRGGDARHFRIGVAFDGGLFSVRVADEDHPVDHGSFTSAQVLATGSVTLSAPNELDLTAGDAALPDPVVKVKCSLSTPPSPTPTPE